VPNSEAWEHERLYILNAKLTSKSESTYRSGLRLFADWVQTSKKTAYQLDDSWPLSPAFLDSNTVMGFQKWLSANRGRGTGFSYISAVNGYLFFLDTIDELPQAVQLGKIQQQSAEFYRLTPKGLSLDIDELRGAISEIVSYYDTRPLPTANDGYNRRLSLLRNRAIVHVLSTTGFGVSQVATLNKTDFHDTPIGELSLLSHKGEKLSFKVSEDAKNAIKLYLEERTDQNPALFISHSRNAKNRRLSITTINQVIKKAVQELGLRQNISPQHFRIAFEQSYDTDSDTEETSWEVLRIFANISVTIKTSTLDDSVKDIALFDLEQARLCFFSGAFKACIIQLGAILEGIMLGTLIQDDVLKYMQTGKNSPPNISRLGLQDPQLRRKIAVQLTFEDYKDAIHHLVPHIEKLKVDSIQSFRNAIHPWKSIQYPLVFADNEWARTRALHHLTSLEILAHNILSWIPKDNSGSVAS
jgi:hypothetical protein